MTWEEERWIRKQLRRLHRLGAPADVVNRWEVWLAASAGLPSGAVARDWLAEHLDDLDRPMPETIGFVFN